MAEFSNGRKSGSNLPDLSSGSLSRPVRACAVTIGFASPVAGGVAVFVTTAGWGAVALLAVGVTMLLIGWSGRLPNRLKFGENQAFWGD